MYHSPFCSNLRCYLFNRKGSGYLLTSCSYLVWLQFLYLTIYAYDTFLLVLFFPLLFSLGHIQIMLTSVIICKADILTNIVQTKVLVLLEIILKHIFPKCIYLC